MADRNRCGINFRLKGNLAAMAAPIDLHAFSFR
jgi:hypothetical protein